MTEPTSSSPTEPPAFPGPPSTESTDEAAYAAPALKPPAGAVAWAMGFLAYIPVPVVGSLVCAVVMMLVGNAQKSKNEVARLNGVNAANWGFTYLAATLLLLGGAVVAAIVASGAPGEAANDSPVVALLLLALWLFPLQLAHIVLTIVGVVKASGGKVFRNPVAIPLLR